MNCRMNCPRRLFIIHTNTNPSLGLTTSKSRPRRRDCRTEPSVGECSTIQATNGKKRGRWTSTIVEKRLFQLADGFVIEVFCDLSHPRESASTYQLLRSAGLETSCRDNQDRQW